MKVAVLGASLSAQTVSHETKSITGYSEALRVHHAKELNITELKQFTYPGNRLSDGGLICLQRIISWKPDVCLLEPLVEDPHRGREATEDEMLFFYATLSQHAIVPITLFAPHPQTGDSRPWPLRNAFLSIIEKYNLPLLDPALGTSSANSEELFRGVHTTAEGAIELADAIAEGLSDVFAGLQSGKLSDGINAEWPPLPIEVRPIPFAEMAKLQQLEMGIRLPKPTSVKVIQLQEVGAHSPVLQVTATENSTQESKSEAVSVWDPYCHYLRKSYVTLCDFNLESGEWRIKADATAHPRPDRSTCRRTDIVWPQDNELYMKPLDDLFLISREKVYARLISCT